MNIQEYISCGILESYVLGVATPEEKAEFEKMCAAYPELSAARDAFERKLEEHALHNAISPSGEVKDKIFSEIEIAGERSHFDTLGTELYPNAKAAYDVAESETPIINIGWRYLAVASVILLIVSIGANLYFFRKYKESTNQYNALVSSQTQMVGNYKLIQSKLQEKENTIFMMKDTGMRVIKMLGKNVPTSPFPSSLATVYWDKRTKDVFIMANAMPLPGTDKQYQLWAIVNGQPVDAGVFDVNDPHIRLRMKTIRNAQAFAVTLEKKGGSSKPNMQAMYVMGKV